MAFPENLAQLASGSAGKNAKGEKEELAPRPVSVIGMSPSHRRVHSEAICITVMAHTKRLATYGREEIWKVDVSGYYKTD